jgi:hypothetical protein
MIELFVHTLSMGGVKRKPRGKGETPFGFQTKAAGGSGIPPRAVNGFRSWGVTADRRAQGGKRFTAPANQIEDECFVFHLSEFRQLRSNVV